MYVLQFDLCSLRRGIAFSTLYTNIANSSYLFPRVYYGYSAKTLQLKQIMVNIQMVRREEVSNACDVYSYGVLLREIITHEMPAVNMGKIYEGKTEVGYASLAIHD